MIKIIPTKLAFVNVKLLSSLTIIFLAIGLVPAFAQTTINEEIAGVTPDNPLYIFDVFGDDFLLAITTEPNEKALLGLQIANERLAEVDLSIARQNVESAEKAQKEHARTLTEIENTIEESEQAITVQENEAELDVEFEKTLTIREMLTVHKAEVDEVKERVKLILTENRNRLAGNENLPEDRIDQITFGLDNAIEQVEVKIDDRKTRIEVQFEDRFDKSNLDIKLKESKFKAMAGNEVQVRLSNSGQGSFSSGSSNSDSDSSSDRSGSNSDSG